MLSVPHDGRTELPSIPERRPGCRDAEAVCRYPGAGDCSEDRVCRVITGPDTNAADIARTVFNKILEVTGRTPALVISHLHRSRLDPNRPVEEAAQGNKEAISAYKAFHQAIADAHRAVGDRPGLHIDFHGYRDVKKYVIYLLTFIL